MVTATAMFERTVKKLKKFATRSGVDSKEPAPLPAVIERTSCTTRPMATMAEVAAKNLRPRSLLCTGSP